MNIFFYLFQKFFEQQKVNIGLMCVLSLVISFFYTNVSSVVNANIIEGIQKNDLLKTDLNFKYFIGISVFFVVVYYVYKMFQNTVLTTLSHWVKSEVFNFLLKLNNDNMRNVNYVDFITPITRISGSCTSLLNDILTDVFPTFGVLVVIFVYFMMKDRTLGLGFLIGNFIIFFYLFWFWKDIFKYKQEQELKVVKTERHIIDSLNNFDKIIYRGEVAREIDELQEKTEDCKNFNIDLLRFITNHVTVVNIIIFIIIILSVGHIIELQRSKKISNTTFITFLGILFMYRDNILGSVQGIPYNIEVIGRIDLMIQELDELIGKKMDLTHFDDAKDYKPVVLEFDKIVFQNVSFKYDKTEKPIFQDFNKEVYLKNKIIGIVGLSGNGKSSFAKLMLRLHQPSSGQIFIDDVDIQTVDPYYIRENITYVNQNSRLFDKKIMENILYGCKDPEKCNEHLKDILSYPKIRELYRNVDLESGNAGPLGENLSGGQRQVVNIISGLINPTKVLILDEPTNGLDGDLKREILKVLQNFKKHKKCIMIITHDRDVFQLFDETVEI
jgi:ABC-type multidrug transport system fused ATPase/permease subunit